MNSANYSWGFGLSVHVMALVVGCHCEEFDDVAISGQLAAVAEPDHDHDGKIGAG